MSDDNTVGSVSVDVIANLGPYAALMNQARGQAAEFERTATAGMQNVAKASDQVSVAAGRNAEAMMNLGRATAAQAQQDQIAAIVKAKLAATIGEETAQTTKNTAAHVSSRASLEALVLVHEALSGRFRNMVGSLMIEAQALAGAEKSAVAVKAIMSPLGLTIIGVTGAVVAGAVAWTAYEKAQKEIQASSLGLGAASGLLAADIRNLAEGDLLSLKSSYGENVKAIEAFSAQGIRNRQAIADLTGSYADFAHLTGEKLPAAQKALAEAMKDPAKGAEELNQKLGLLDSTQLQHIRTLETLGDKEGAQAELARLIKQRTDEASEAAGGFQTSWDKVVKSAEVWLHIAPEVIKTAMALDSHIGGAAAANDDRAAAIQRRTRLREDSGAALPLLQNTPEAKAQASRDELQGHMTVLQRAMAADIQLYGLHSAAVDRDRKAMQEYAVAQTSYLSPAEKAHELSVAEAHALAAKTPAQKAAAAAEKERVELSGQVMSLEERRQRLADARAKGGARTPKDTFGPESASIEQDIQGQLALAQAYGVSDAEAMKAEATRKALTEATKQSRTEAQKAKLVQDEINLAAATAAAQEAKKASEINAETQARARADAAVAAGTITRKEADEQVKEEIQLRPIEAAVANASGEAKAKLTAVLERLKKAQAEANVEAARAIAIDTASKDRDEIAVANLRGSMIGEPRAKTDAAVARLQRTQELGDKNAATSEGRASIASAGDAAAARARTEGLQQFREMTLEVEKETQALQKQQATLGMTLEEADKYNETQKLLLEAKKDGIALSPAELSNIDKLAAGYAKASDSARQLAEQQRGLANAAKAVADDFESEASAVIFDGKKPGAAARDLAKTLGKDAFKATTTGEGPLAGLFGTDQTKTVGGMNGGVLSQLAGSVFGVGKSGAAKPTGTANDPLYVQMAGGAASSGAGGGGGIMGMIQGLFGGGGGIGGMGGAPGADVGGSLTELAGLFHTGTSYVGTPHRQVAVSPGLFLGAPRLHSGLAPDEFPAILQRGEKVTARDGRTGRGGGRVININVQAQDAPSFGRSQRQIERAYQRRAGRPG